MLISCNTRSNFYLAALWLPALAVVGLAWFTWPNMFQDAAH